MDRHNRFRNVPNILSAIRLLMVPLFIVLFFCGDALWKAGLVYALAGLTDILDGAIARRTGNITKLGRIIDPLADKLMQVSAFACLAIRGIIPVWVILTLAVKESLMLIGGLIVLRRCHDVPPSNRFGKAASTVFYFVTISVIVFDMPHALQLWLLAGALALSLSALIAYSLGARRYMAGGQDGDRDTPADGTRQATKASTGVK